MCVYGTGTETVCDKQNKSSESDLMVLFSCMEGTAKVIDSYCVRNISAASAIHYLLNVMHNLMLSGHYHVHTCVKLP